MSATEYNILSNYVINSWSRKLPVKHHYQYNLGLLYFNAVFSTFQRVDPAWNKDCKIKGSVNESRSSL